MYLEVCNCYKMNFIDRRHIKVLENGKNTLLKLFLKKRHFSCRVLAALIDRQKTCINDRADPIT